MSGHAIDHAASSGSSRTRIELARRDARASGSTSRNRVARDLDRSLARIGTTSALPAAARARHDAIALPSATAQSTDARMDFDMRSSSPSRCGVFWTGV
ncbi:hypothetical protein DB32_007199 [Sandaracinus amylolyticus]|uniref:Uncharacterized protein n=1 Tax=Sandaracinus amylolyticus TaxID=927083 RepID=A0A0F6W8A9_9BACT|nr:hypothetical protein DB32_007199 [Sandaracinus amylolyticus]